MVDLSIVFCMFTRGIVKPLVAPPKKTLKASCFSPDFGHFRDMSPTDMSLVSFHQKGKLVWLVSTMNATRTFFCYFHPLCYHDFIEIPLVKSPFCLNQHLCWWTPKKTAWTPPEIEVVDESHLLHSALVDAGLYS
jgi:hypothetical protein